MLSIEDQQTLNQIADYLVAAGNYIAEHGWCTQVAQDKDGRVCAAGAIVRVVPGGFRHFVHMALIGYLGESYIPAWNDSSSKAEVIQAFYDTAAKIRPDAYHG